MIIKGTEKIKGVIDLSSIKLQLKRGTVYSISDKDYWNSDVQSAIRMGFLTSAGDPSKDSDGETKKVVRCINVHNRPLNINIVSKSDIMPNHSFTIPEELLEHPDIRAAKDRGMIQVTQVVDPGDYSEGFLKIGDMFLEEENKKKAEKQKEAQIFKLQMEKAKQDMQKTVELETNEALPPLKTTTDKLSLKDAIRTKTASEIEHETENKEPKKSMVNIIDDANPKPVKATDDNKRQVLFVDPNKDSTPKQSYVHDPNRNEPSKSSVIDTDTPKPVKSTEYDTKPVVANAEKKEPHKQSIVWNPTRAPIQKIKTVRDENEDVLFADKEAEQERIAKHPILGKNPQVAVEEDDPISPDSIDENRIAKHPVLGKKQQSE